MNVVAIAVVPSAPASSRGEVYPTPPVKEVLSASEAAARRAAPFHSAAAGCAGALRFVLVGKGPLGRHVAARLSSIGRPPLAFVDNDRASWGTTVLSVPVLSPDDAAREHGASAIFIVTIYNGRRVREQFALLRCVHVLHVEDLFFGMPDVFLPYYQLDLPASTIEARDEIAAVATMWADTTSRRIYDALIARRMGLAHAGADIVGSPRDCYFDPELFALRGDDCIVDCGAYDGDTIRWVFANALSLPRKIIALEPDPCNAAALRAFVSTLDADLRARIVVHEVAASAHPGFVPFDPVGTVAASVGAGAHRVEASTLDTLVLNDAPTIIKMDVEGHEVSALEGAVETIRAHRPVLAISLYHRCTDLWRIPTAILCIEPSYRLHLRCYAEDGWESVCYAIPLARSTRPA